VTRPKPSPPATPAPSAGRIGEARAGPPFVVAAVHMGYGHMRAADALATAAGTPIAEVDRPPHATEAEVKSWERLRVLYEALSRGTERRIVGPLLDRVMYGITKIPRMDRAGRQAGATRAVRYLSRMARDGLCERFTRGLKESGAGLLTTFYAPAILADAAGVGPAACVVTDADVNRVWVAEDPASSRVLYLAPAHRSVRRLRAYGVPKDRIVQTGFPLPPGLASPAALERNLARRLARLDPKGAFLRTAPEAARTTAAGADPAVREQPPLVTFAIGGAGAQRKAALEVLRALAPRVRAGRVRLCLVAGTRRDARDAFTAAAQELRLPLGDGPASALSLLYEDAFPAYVRRFDATIAETDVLFTKPSELVFFAALGLPLALTRPIGAQEVANRRWVHRRRSAVDAPSASATAAWLEESTANGELASLAWRARERLPSDGTDRILAAFSRERA
jgi:hypothetical protein